MKCLFLYNPNSGKGLIKRKLRFIEKRLKKRYQIVDICATQSADDLEQKVRCNSKAYDAIVFSGGDGTFNNVLRGAAESGVQLGYLPSGTVNDVARSLGIPRNVRGALKVILKGRSEELDCMRIGDYYAMYIAAAGAFTSATYHTPQNIKRALGALAYAFEAVKHNLKLEVFPLHVTSGGESVQTNAVLVLVLNGRSVAGFPINKSASMRDGMLETVIIKQVRRPNFFQKISALFSVASLFMFGCKIKKKDVICLHGDRVNIQTAESVVWDYDGEEGNCGSVTVEVLPRSVKMFVPKRKKV